MKKLRNIFKCKTKKDTTIQYKKLKDIPSEIKTYSKFKLDFQNKQFRS